MSVEPLFLLHQTAFASMSTNQIEINSFYKTCIIQIEKVHTFTSLLISIKLETLGTKTGESRVGQNTSVRAWLSFTWILKAGRLGIKVHDFKITDRGPIYNSFYIRFIGKLGNLYAVV